MKVALLNTFLKGGAGIACRRLAIALRKSGIDAEVLVEERFGSIPGFHTTTQSALDEFFNKIRLAKEVFTFARNAKFKEDRFKFSVAQTGIDISNHPVIQSADILHLHWINQGFLSLKSLEKLSRLSKPIVWTMHDMWPFTGGCHYSRGCENYKSECQKCPYLRNPSPEDLSNKTFRRKIELLERMNVTFVGCSRWMQQLAKQSTLVKKFRIETIPNPIDTELFKPTDKREARKKWNLPLDKKLILFGAMDLQDKRKGFDYLLEALHFIANNHPEMKEKIEVMLIGRLKTDIGNALPFKVNHLGVIYSEKEIAEAYSAADVFVLPSVEDNLPNMIMESLSCGTPVAAFNTGGIPEMIEHFQTGFLADYQSSLSLADGIYALLSNERDFEIREKCRTKTLTFYNEKVVAQKYNDLYLSLLK